jgi:zinc/manganese transport system substrate-binding protein
MKTRFTLLLSAAILILASFAAHAAPVKIVAAENFYGGIAQLIAGSDAQVTSILSNPNQDPHEFTSSASTAKAVSDANFIIYSGIGYDTWMEKLLSSQGKPDRIVIDVAGLINANDGDNPHIWYDPRTMSALADELASILGQRDAAHAQDYQKRATDFKSAMKPELDKIAALKAKYAGTTVTATEPVFGYMATALGFKMLNYDFQINVMNDTEPSARQTADFEKSLKTKAVKLLFYNSQVTDPTTERIKKIAQDAGIPIIGVTETQPSDEKSYAGWMMSELNAVEAGLDGVSR